MDERENPRIDLIDELADRLWGDNVVVVADEPLRLKAGRETHVYVNFRDFVCLPANLALLADVFAALTGEAFARPFALGAAASLTSPIFCGAFSARLGSPLVLHRPGGGEKGLDATLFRHDRNPSSDFPADLPVLLVDDVVSSGGTAARAAEAMTGAGLEVLGLFAFVDKRNVSAESLPFEILAPLTLSGLLERGLARGQVPTERRGFVEAELEWLAS